MKKMIMIAALATAAGAAVWAHGGATGVVKERMDGMAAMGKAVKSLAPMMRGEEEYDAHAVREAAAVISRHAGEAITSRFPEGTTAPPSEAKDAIWENWGDFSALAQQLAVAADGLELAAANGLAAAGGGMSADSMMGGNSMMGGKPMMGGSSMMGGSDTMMGGGSAMGGAPGQGMTAEQIGAMPASAAFEMTSRVCSTCHTRFRAEDD
ncbi:c-type cytochrome [Tranquillimonas alkanivorans]|uniref:Cytochrome c556 n=1 Tax=Tranquillimonas alkanivorans TaxID=441119 RepID=A0A1I5V443_9RHOB|nr:cytochrome c [Tranquillimonas alkanivorans]SFQ02273.1 Cytochrome c556 [Tranquillimonas alkanivorans]